ncbi:hypothetical protein FPHYL_5408 [Fusarium phyllophilum]|uniref:Uncharacterized protein n=1 Tax=Fusarium phyllophilum TaxID=47803 RepID=A0A8H5JZ18_9HYPO|nr:hypothetical protein FPHYL_5408 [Fusarium phyllophilum]
MTTNSFGSALPRFDFPRQPAAPKLTAQAARAFPTVAIVATAEHKEYKAQGGDNAFGTDGGNRVMVDGVLNGQQP